MYPARATTSNLLDEEDEDVATQQLEITNLLSTQQFTSVAKGRRGIRRCQAGKRRGEDHKIGMKRTPPWHPPLPSFFINTTNYYQAGNQAMVTDTVWEGEREGKGKITSADYLLFAMVGALISLLHSRY